MASLSEQIQIEKVGLPRRTFSELYYSILKMSWFRFLLLLAIVYIILNAIFAGLFLLGDDPIANVVPGSFFDAFVFSNQTFATIGFGYYLPQTPYAHLLVVLESIIGIIFSALITGLTFAKFSRPTAHVIFSKKAVIIDYDGVPTLMFRMGNGRDTNIVDAKVSVVTLVSYKSKEGQTMQRFVDLKLERNHSPFFLLTWTLFHKIDQTSPFYGLSEEEFRARKTNLYVSLVGYDETFAQTIHSGWRYKTPDIYFSKKFVDVIEVTPNDGRRLNFNKFHDIEG